MRNFLRTILFLVPIFFEPAASVLAGTQAGSLYDYQAQLVDQDGKKSGLDVFAGHPVVVGMFYSSCNYSCPLLIDVLKKMESRLDAASREKVRILLISFDPKNDTPAALRKLALEQKVDLVRFKFAAPTPEAVRDIAALLDFVYRPLPQGGFNHTSSLTLLDETGLILHSEEGMNNAASSIVDILKKRK